MPGKKVDKQCFKYWCRSLTIVGRLDVASITNVCANIVSTIGNDHIKFNNSNSEPSTKENGMFKAIGLAMFNDQLLW